MNYLLTKWSQFVFLHGIFSGKNTPFLALLLVSLLAAGWRRFLPIRTLSSVASNKSTDEFLGMRSCDRDLSRLVVSAARAALLIRLVIAEPGVESCVTSH